MTNAWFDAPAPLLPEVLALNGRWGGARPAVICDGQVLSWAEFHRRVCQVANGLRADGLETGDRVAVLMSNGPEMLIALFAIITAGGVAVPLNVMVSEAALLSMMHDAKVRGLFATSDHANRMQHLQAQLPERRYCVPWPDGNAPAHGQIDGWVHFEKWLTAQDDQDPQIPLNDGHECNIIYSSGTTGQPKGIVHTHRRRLDWFYDLSIALRVHRASVNLCSIGLFSNISWAAMGCMALTGSTLVIMREFNTQQWQQLVAKHRVTLTAMVPVQFQRLLEDPSFAEADLGSIESLMCCGSPLSAALKQAIMERMSPRLIELYGLTEGLITTLEPEEAAGRLHSVGKPLMGTDLLILDEKDQPAPCGEEGEIVGRGRILMAGYHARDEANREATWTDDLGRRWLRTGDVGRLDEDGYLTLVDRKKDLIISGGLNLYPADLEAVIVQHEAVSEVAVIAIDSKRWGESPFAVYLGADLAPEALVAWTNERVGKHQRLAGAARVDTLPRNANGKVLKRELRETWRDWLSGPGAGS